MRAHPGEMRATFHYLEGGRLALWCKKRMPGGLYFYYFLWQWKLRGLVKRMLREDRYDLIHHVTFASFRMPVGARGAPVVWGPVGGAERASPALLRGHGTRMGRVREHFRNLTTSLAGRLMRLWSPVKRGEGIALASTPATFALLEKNGIPCERMPTIGYDSPVAGEEEAGAPPEAPLRLLYVGRLHLLKGLHLLLQAMERLGDQPVRLTIVGEGAERSRLEGLVRALGLGSRVSFRGHVPRAGLGGVYAEHDVIAAPSLYESGGLSVLEGFAHGLPAIVLDCGGPALTVAEGCGIKVPADLSQDLTVARLAGAIEVYLKDRELVRRHGGNARKRVVEEYGWASKRRRMLGVYQRLLNGEFSN
jgi:glycosyltransferase involved in cell wall biosynthesis